MIPHARIPHARLAESVFADPAKPTVKEMVAFGLPRPMAQALYSHWSESKQVGNAYDVDKLARLLGRALNDMDMLARAANP